MVFVGRSALVAVGSPPGSVVQLVGSAVKGFVEKMSFCTQCIPRIRENNYD